MMFENNFMQADGNGIMMVVLVFMVPMAGVLRRPMVVVVQDMIEDL